jgi:ribosomal protein S18 acetylase RimI-like enzyme
MEHLRWKRSSHPDAGRYQCVAELGGRIVGVQLYFVQDVKVGDEILQVAPGTDFCVHPDFQRRGVRRAMYDHSFSTVEVGTALILTHDSDHPAMVRVEETGPLPRTAIANKIMVLEARTAASQRPQDSGHVRVDEVNAFDAGTDAFCVAASEPFQLIVMRSQRYLNWRYADKRAGMFTIYVAEERDALAGYVVASVSRGRGYIADLLVSPGRLDVAEALLRRALAGFARDGIGAAECWSMVHHAYLPAVLAAGFESKRRTRFLWTRPRGGRPERVTFARDPKARVHFLAGDTDLV